MNAHADIDPIRLVAAADLVLDVAKAKGGIARLHDILQLGAEDAEDDSGEGFTRTEIEAALAFLTRLGVIAATSTPNSAG